MLRGAQNRAGGFSPRPSAGALFATTVLGETSRCFANRFWHYADPSEVDGVWTASLPLASTNEPLWVYANVEYPLAEPVTGAGYYYRASGLEFLAMVIPHVALRYEVRIRSYGAISTTIRRALGWVRSGAEEL